MEGVEPGQADQLRPRRLSYGGGRPRGGPEQQAQRARALRPVPHTWAPQARAPTRHDHSNARRRRAHPLQPTERDRSRPPPIANATRERDDRDRRATALELLPHSLASRQLPTPRTQPGRMRPGALTTRRRLARVAGQRPTGPARALPPAPRYVHPLGRTRALPRRIPILSTARARRRPAVRAPLIQPCPAVAHGRSRAFAPRSWSPFWSPIFFLPMPVFATQRMGSGGTAGGTTGPI